MKHIRSDKKNEHANAIVPGVSSLCIVITDLSIDENPTAKETMQMILHRVDKRRRLVKKRAIFLQADAGELVPLITQTNGSPFEPHICPWPGGLHIVFAAMGSVATFMDGWGAATAMTACKWFGSVPNAVKALKAKDYNRENHHTCYWAAPPPHALHETQTTQIISPLLLVVVHHAGGISALKMLWESLGVMRIDRYVDHITQRGTAAEKICLAQFTHLLAAVREGGDPARRASQSAEAKEFLKRMDAWSLDLESKSGDAKFAGIVRRAIEAILAFIWASRTVREVGVHGWFGAIEELMPYLSEADRLVYMRLLVIIRDLVLHFEEKYGPELYAELKSGRGLGIIRVADAFCAIWGDLHLEQGTNRFGKMMLQYVAARRDAMFAQLAALPEQMRTTRIVEDWGTQIVATKPKRSPRPPKVPWTKRSPRHVKNVARMQTYLSDVTDPFPAVGATGLIPDEVAHLTSGVVPPKKVSKSILQIEQAGKERWDSWIQRYEAHNTNLPSSADNPNVFWPMKKSGLVNFARGNKRAKKGASDGKENKMLAGFTLKLLSANESLEQPIKIWDINNSNCLARFELSIASHMLFKDGSYRKGTKALLMNSVVPNPPHSRHAPGHDWSRWAAVIDYAAFLQKAPRAINTNAKWLVELVSTSATMGLNEALRCEAGTVIFACDSYPETGSPKDLEQWHRCQGREVTAYREIRGRTHAEPTEMLSPKPLQDFLSDGKNKTALVQHLECELLGVLNAGNADAQRYVVLERCILINSQGLKSWITIERDAGGVWKVVSRSGLQLQWIEADQLIPISVKWWNRRAGTAGSKVCCEDADVHLALFVHVMALANGKAVTLVKTAGGNRRDIDIVASMAKFKQAHGEVTARKLAGVLMAVYCATGCDTNGYPYGSPKTTVWQRLLTMLDTHPALFDSLAKVGRYGAKSLADEDQRGVRADLDHAYARLLGCSDTSLSCDEYKGRKMKKGGLTELKKMPPTSGSTDEQWARADWQTETWWVSVHTPEADPPDPLRGDRGYRMHQMVKGDTRTDMIGPVYTKRGIAPEQILKAPGCGCDKGGTATHPHFCVTDHCPCFDAGVTCTDICRCKCAVCKNRGEDQPAQPAQLAQPQEENEEPGTSSLDDELANNRTARRGQGGTNPHAGPGPAATYHIASLVARKTQGTRTVRVGGKKITQKIKGPKNPNGAMYKVRWGGQDAGGRAYGAKDDTWEVVDHGDEANLSRCLHFNRLLNELCARDSMPLRNVQADRYAPDAPATTEGEEEAMMAASESETESDAAEASADDMESDDTAASDDEASDASEESDGGSSEGTSQHSDSSYNDEG